jgi:hypothetical protein
MLKIFIIIVVLVGATVYIGSTYYAEEIGNYVWNDR